MSHNRFTFVTGFAILALAVVGAQVLWDRATDRRWWYLLPAIALAAIGAFWAYRSVALPEPLATELTRAIDAGHPHPPLAVLLRPH